MLSFKNQIEVTQNSYKDEGDGVVCFPNGLTISDNQLQRNGTRYDIESLDISKYAGQLTADHEDKLSNVIGRVEGVKKDKNRVTIDKIVYAVKQNPYARLAYDLLVGGFSRAFSTETIGASANDLDGTLSNHELVGLSQVVTPNNYSAVVNTIHNSLAKAKEDGLDIADIENKFLNNIKVEENKMDKEAPKTTEEVVETTETVEAVEETPEIEAPAEVEETSNSVENEAEKAEETPAEEPAEEVEETETENKAVKKVENEISDEQVVELFDKIDSLTALVEERLATDDDKIEDEGVAEVVIDEVNEAKTKKSKKENKMDKEEVVNTVTEVLKNYFGEQAKAPEFKKDANSATKTVADMDWKERYNKQINSAWEAFRLGNISARKTLNEINEVNLGKLQEAGLVKNTMTIDSMGNFVIPPEMYDEIVGKRTDYSAILNATEWRETDSLEFAWLKRNGDIDMRNIALCDDGQNGNLKPISEYSAEPQTEKLEEMAAVTVVCNAATRFFAVDLLADVAAGYRNDYDRKRAQLVIAKLEQAVIESDQSVTYAPTTDTGAIVAWLNAITKVSDAATNGTLVFNNNTYSALKAHALEAGVNGPLSNIFTDGEIPMIFGTPFIVVPNDLMPSLEGSDTVTFQVAGENVTITHAAFYADLSEFVGFTSGGLQYDLSTDASYEVNGTTRSAYQRNEMVLRGSFFRGGAVKDASRVSGIKQAEVES